MRNIFCLCLTVMASIAFAKSNELTQEQRDSLKYDYHIAIIAKAPIQALLNDFHLIARGQVMTDAQETMLAKFAGIDDSDYKMSMAQFKKNYSGSPEAKRNLEKHILADLATDKMRSMDVTEVRIFIRDYYHTLTAKQQRVGLFGRANSAWNKKMNITETSGTPYLTAYSQFYGENYLCGKKAVATVMSGQNVTRQTHLQFVCENSTGVVVVHTQSMESGKQIDLPILIDLGDGVVYMNNIEITHELLDGKEVFTEKKKGATTFTLQFLQQ